MSEQVQLSGDALTGIAVSDRHMGLVSQLPQTVYLGRARPKSRPLTYHLSDYVDDLMKLAGSLPATIDWYTAAAESIAHVMLNDREGDCVIAGKGHLIGAWSANNLTLAGGKIIIPTDQEVQQLYNAWKAGPGDSGCVITDVLDNMVNVGFLAGGVRYKLDGYCAVDWRSKDLVRAAIYLFGGACIGINLPSAWTSNAVWDVTNTRIVGGHDVSPLGSGPPKVINVTADGVVIASWGRLYLITWEAYVKTDHIEEMYVMVPSKLWAADIPGPSGFQKSVLLDDFKYLKSGTIPPLDPGPPPPPPPPPGPPPPPPPPPAVHGVAHVQAVQVKVPFFGGTITIPAQDAKVEGALGQLGAGGTPEVKWPGWAVAFRDGQHLIAAVRSGDLAAIREAVSTLLTDFGINLPVAQYAYQPARQTAGFDWQKAIVIAGDVGALVAAASRKDWLAVMAAAQKLLADLGLSV